MDLEKTATYCDERVKEVKCLIQKTLWSTFGKAEVLTALQVAEAECEHAATIKPGVETEAYNFTLSHLKELLKSAKEVYGRWKKWIPRNNQKGIQDQLKMLDLEVPKLVSRTAEFIHKKLQKDGERREQMGVPPNYSLPTIKLKPTSLPKFVGNKCDFYR